MLSSTWSKVKSWSQFCDSTCIKFSKKHEIFFCICQGNILAVPNAFRKVQNTFFFNEMNTDKVNFNTGGREICTLIMSDGAGGGEIATFDLSNNGDIIVTAGRNLLIRSWKIEYKFNAGQKEISCEAKERDIEDSWISAKQIKVWKGVKSHITSVSIDGTSTLVVIGTVDGHVFVFNLHEGFSTHMFRMSKSAVSIVRFHDEKLSVFAGSTEGELRIWNLHSNSCVCVCTDHLSFISDICFIKTQSSKNQMGFITSGRDKIINIYSLNVFLLEDKKKNTQGKKSTKVNADEVESPTVLKPIQQIATYESVECILSMPYSYIFGDKERTVEDQEDKRNNEALSQSIEDVKEKKSYPSNLASSSPWVILSGGESGDICVWNPINKQKISKCKCSLASNNAIHRLIEIGKHGIFALCKDFYFFFFKIPQLALVGGVSSGAEDFLDCKFMPVFHFNRFYIKNLKEKGMYESNNFLKYSEGCLNRNETEEKNINNCEEEWEERKSVEKKLSEEKKRKDKIIAVDGSVRFLTLSGYEIIKVNCFNPFFSTTYMLVGHTDIVLCTDVSSHGCWICSGSKDNSIRIWQNCENASSTHENAFQCVAILKGHISAVTALAILKNKKLKSEICECEVSKEMIIVSASADGLIKEWKVRLENKARNNANQGIQIIERSESTVVAHKKDVNNISFSSNNKVIATCSQDKMINIWSFPLMKLLGVCAGHRRGVWNTVFSSVEKILASSSADMTVKLWNIKDFSCIKTFQDHEGIVFKCLFLKNSIQIMSCSSDNLIKLWNIRTSDCINTFDAHEDKVWSIDISDDFMVSGGADGKLVLWKDVSTEVQLQQLKLKEQQILEEEKINLLIKNGNIDEAMTTCLTLNRTSHLRNIFVNYSNKMLKSAINKNVRKKSLSVREKESHCDNSGFSNNKSVVEDFYRSNQTKLDIQKWLKMLPNHLLSRLVKMICTWNSNSKTSYFANFLMQLILLNFRRQQLYSIEGFAQLMESFIEYSGKHENRIANLIQKSYIIDMLSDTRTIDLTNFRNCSKTMDINFGENETIFNDVKTKRNKRTYMSLYDNDNILDESNKK